MAEAIVCFVIDVQSVLVIRVIDLQGKLTMLSLLSAARMVPSQHAKLRKAKADQCIVCQWS
jgi:hypothetical protein